MEFPLYKNSENFAWTNSVEYYFLANSADNLPYNFDSTCLKNLTVFLLSCSETSDRIPTKTGRKHTSEVVRQSQHMQTSLLVVYKKLKEVFVTKDAKKKIATLIRSRVRQDKTFEIFLRKANVEFIQNNN